jgi:hypothetical protein
LCSKLTVLISSKHNWESWIRVESLADLETMCTHINIHFFPSWIILFAQKIGWLFHLETAWMLFEIGMFTLWQVKVICNSCVIWWFLVSGCKKWNLLTDKIQCNHVKPYLLNTNKTLHSRIGLNRFLILLTKVWCIKTPNISPNFLYQLWIIILQLNPTEFLWERSNYIVFSVSGIIDHHYGNYVGWSI